MNIARENITLEERPDRIYYSNNIEIYYIPAGKFKTNTITFFFFENLTRNSVSKNALIPAVLRRGCRDYPEMVRISMQLEKFYGCSFDCSVAKKGEYHIIYFHSEFISDKYVNPEEELFKNVFELILKIIVDPVTENGLFKSEYVEQEKETVKKIIERRINDKVQYAVERCIEEMCKNEPYGIYEYGDIEGLESITLNSLYDQYRNMIENYPLIIYITGDVQREKLSWATEKINKIFGSIRKNPATVESSINNILKNNIKMQKGSKINKTEGNNTGGNVRYINENIGVNQAKLSLGFRTGISPQENHYYSFVVFDRILGGGVYSKLFQNVREQQGLAYYIFSQYEKFKGLLLVSCGIDADQKEKTIDIILKQIDEMKSGNITDYELDSALKSIKTDIHSLRDSQLQIAEFYLSQILAGTRDDFGLFNEKTGRVSAADVINVSKMVQLDTVYFLT